MSQIDLHMLRAIESIVRTIEAQLDAFQGEVDRSAYKDRYGLAPTIESNSHYDLITAVRLSDSGVWEAL